MMCVLGEEEYKFIEMVDYDGIDEDEYKFNDDDSNWPEMDFYDEFDIVHRR